MKKSLLITTSLLTLWVVTGIYAQVTGTSVVDKMKAVAHSFTLAATLNPSDAGLTSDPVKGKKTGDILTAGEYNRLLELVSEGNTGTTVTGGGVEIVDGGIISTTATSTEKNLWSNWDLISLTGSYNSGDAGATGWYIYKLGGQKKMSIVEATGLNKDAVLTTTEQCVYNLCVKLSGDNVIIKPSNNTVAYLIWKFTGGSGSSSSSGGPGSACGADGYGIVMYQSTDYNPRKKQCCYIGNGWAVSGGYHDGLVRHLSCTDL